MQAYLQGKNSRAELTPSERQLFLQAYSVHKDYAEIIIQFGFVTLFISVLPILSLFAFVACILEQKVDMIKLGRCTRRPMPKDAIGIGFWMGYLEGTSQLAVLTNAAMFAFNTGALPDLGSSNRPSVRLYASVCPSVASIPACLFASPFHSHLSSSNLFVSAPRIQTCSTR